MAQGKRNKPLPPQEGEKAEGETIEELGSENKTTMGGKEPKIISVRRQREDSNEGRKGKGKRTALSKGKVTG